MASPSGPARAPLTPFDFLLYAATVLTWSGGFIALHFQLGVVDPEVSVVWRFVIAGPIMLALAKFRGERLTFPLVDHFYFAVLGMTLFSFNFALFYYGGRSLASGLLSVVFSLASVANILLGALLLRLPIDRRVAMGALLGAVGVAGMFLPEIVQTQINVAAAVGFALCVAGTLLFSLGSIVSTRLKRRSLPVFAASGWSMIYGALLLAAFAAARGLPFRIEPTALYIGALLYVSVIASVVGVPCYFTLLGRIGADRAGYTTVMFPVVALAISTWLEGYRWTLPAFLGLLAVLAGNLLVLRTPR